MGREECFFFFFFFFIIIFIIIIIIIITIPRDQIQSKLFYFFLPCYILYSNGPLSRHIDI